MLDALLPGSVLFHDLLASLDAGLFDDCLNDELPPPPPPALGAQLRTSFTLASSGDVAHGSYDSRDEAAPAAALARAGKTHLQLSCSVSTDKALALIEHCAKREREVVDPDTRHDLPVARVKRLMKEHSCHAPNAIATDVPGMLARTVELFVTHAAAQGSLIAIERGRNVLQSRDLKVMLEREAQYAFLQEIYDECSGAAAGKS